MREKIGPNKINYFEITVMSHNYSKYKLCRIYFTYDFAYLVIQTKITINSINVITSTALTLSSARIICVVYLFLFSFKLDIYYLYLS